MSVVIHRSRHTQEYAVVPNVVARDTQLSFRARGLLVMLLSLPPDWHVTTDQLAEDNPEGRDLIRRAMTELRDAGYVQVHREQDGGGRWRTCLEVFDTAQPDATRPASGATSGNTMSSQVAPNAELPTVGKPDATRPAPNKSTEPKYGPKGTKGSAANSQNPRVHDGPDHSSSDAQQIPDPVTRQSPATDRNAREADQAERQRQHPEAAP
jgi:hypothetical protein